MPKAQSIALRIRSARETLGFSQADAAKRWGFSLKTLQAWEQGARKPAGLYLEKLEKVLKKAEA